MVRIPGWVFMIVGIVISGYSKFIESKRPEVNLVVFFWAGILFIIFGFFREARKRLSKKKEEKEPVGPPPNRQSDNDHRHPGGNKFHGRSHHETHQHTKPAKHHSHPHEPPHKSCPRCHINNSNHARFCNKCAYQFY